VLPRSIATFEAFENALTLDIAMGGSTNTILHILAIAHEAGVDFTLADIDRLSRQVPCLCKVAPSSSEHIEDVSRAGGVLAILGALDRAGLLHRDAATVHEPTLGAALDAQDIRRPTAKAEALLRARAAPGGVRTTEAFSQDTYFPTPDLDGARGVIREREHAHSADGGLAVLHGNLASEGCVVKTAGVDPEVWSFEGRARFCE